MFAFVDIKILKIMRNVCMVDTNMYIIISANLLVPHDALGSKCHLHKKYQSISTSLETKTNRSFTLF